MNEKNIERERLEDGLKSTLEEEIKQKNEKIRLMEEELKVQDLEKEVTRQNWEKSLSKKDDDIKVLKDRVQTLQDSNVFRETVVRLEAEAKKQELVRRRLNSEKEKLENNLAKEIKKGEAFNITIKKYEEDFLKLKYQEKEMQKETKILNEKYQQVLRQTEEKEERLQRQQEEVSDLRTRNEVWRNKMKVLEKGEKGNEHGSGSGRKSEDSCLV